jgi:hypothetical protein
MEVVLAGRDSTILIFDFCISNGRIVMKPYQITVATLVFFVLLQGAVYACDVPVFRYAMERWAPDYYEAILLHKGAMTQDDAASAPLQGETAELLNLHLSRLDITSTAQEELKALLGEKVPEKLLTLAIWYPGLKGRTAPFWVGEFTPATVSQLIESPKRKELAKRLTAGQSGVWVLIESGNAAKDKAALQLLNQELEAATRQLKEMLPALAEEAETPGLSFEFSVLPVSRSDPNEQFLLAMLLNSEPDLQNYAGEPILFPVFGRGRALYALVAEGISADNIREAVGFLTGPCGCEVKMMNPGVDLLMAVNWDAAVMQFYQEFYETQQTPMELTSVFPEVPAGSSVALREASDEGQGTMDEGRKIQAFTGLGVMGMAALSLGGIVLIVALGTLAVSRRQKHRQASPEGEQP